MNIEKLDLKHKDLLYPLIKKIQTNIAEYSFANLYLFRKIHSYEVLIDDHVFVRGRTYDGKTYLMPLSPIDEIEMAKIDQLLEISDFIFPVEEKWLSRFAGEKYDFYYKEGDTDYIYDIEKMRTFSGKKLHGKRNLLHQFEKGYVCESLPLFGEKRTEDAIAILERWQKDSGQDVMDTDYHACLEALKLYDELVLCGFIYYVEGTAAGFIIGEEVGSDTFALHFAKGIIDYKGIYQFMFNNFSKILPDKYRYVNFEQDLDKENLRQAKRSYEPDILLKKFRVTKRK